MNQNLSKKDIFSTYAASMLDALEAVRVREAKKRLKMQVYG
jgi:hypothetical protein